MKTSKIIISTVISLLLGTQAYAQDKRSQFNPVEHAVISQTIAPDARSAGMGDVLMNRGWVLLHNPTHGIPFPTKKPEKRYTKAQADFLYDYYIDRGETARANEIFEEM